MSKRPVQRLQLRRSPLRSLLEEYGEKDDPYLGGRGGGEDAEKRPLYRASTGRRSGECERDRYEHNLDEVVKWEAWNVPGCNKYVSCESRNDRAST